MRVSNQAVKYHNLFVSFRVRHMCLGVLLFSAVVAPPALAGRPAITDTDIADALENAFLMESAVPAHTIDLEITQGIVTLSGTVSTLFAKQRATELSQAVTGVRSVVNRVQVQPLTRTDAQIQAAVQAALKADPATDMYELNVAVRAGVVTLDGTVQSWQEQQLAERVVSGVQGVRDVNSTLSVNYTTDRPDDELQAEIQRRLEWDARIDEKLLTVTVENGQVTLQGSVGSAAEKHHVYADAWVPGVKMVDDSGIAIQWWARDEMRRGHPCTTRSDDDLATAIRDAFQYDPRLSPFKPQVRVKNGTVTLRGKVGNLRAKRAAEQDAQNTVCIQRVKNYIKIRPTTPPTDEAVVQEIQQFLAQDIFLNSSEIHVSVSNGVVFLTGTVPSVSDKTRATEAAERANGVREVANTITVAPVALLKEDWEIRQDIKDAFFWDPVINQTEIVVSVQDGTAILAGTVDTWLERRLARQKAYQQGALIVRNHLRVREWPEFEP